MAVSLAAAAESREAAERDRASRDTELLSLRTTIREFAADLVANMCRRLVDAGVAELHFYTLNRPELTRDVCFALGIVPKVRLQNVA